nr:hypothetical protein [uncultured Desulfobulbus sp.]
MMDNQSIERIVRRVLLEIHGSTASATQQSYLILSRQSQVDEVQLRRILPKGTEVRYLDDQEECWQSQVLAEYQGYIVPTLSINTMVELAMGKASDEQGQLILTLLLSGKRVSVVDFAYMAFEQTAPHALWQLYSSQRKQLEAFGLVTYRAAVPEKIMHQGHLVTEHDVERMAQDGVKVVQLAPGAIVTGLAQDKAKSLNIEISRI